MSAVPDVSVVMPCLNEVETLEASIARAREGIRQAGLTGEVVVADNGSTDGSLDIARAAGVRIVHVRERGYGNAYRAGFRGRAWPPRGDGRLRRHVRLLQAGRVDGAAGAGGRHGARVRACAARSTRAPCRGCIATSAIRRCRRCSTCSTGRASPTRTVASARSTARRCSISGSARQAWSSRPRCSSWRLAPAGGWPRCRSRITPGRATRSSGRSGTDGGTCGCCSCTARRTSSCCRARLPCSAGC